jgi:hypothetical protein
MEECLHGAGKKIFCLFSKDRNLISFSSIRVCFVIPPYILQYGAAD